MSGQLLVQITGDEARLVRSLDKIIAKEAQARSGLKSTAEESRRTGGMFDRMAKKGQQAFGVTGTQAAVAGIAIAATSKTIEVATAALTKLGDKAAQLKAEAEASFQKPGLGKLAQLASSKTEYMRLTNAARLTFAEGATESLDQAAQLQFALESAGLQDQRAYFSKLSATQLVADPSGLAKSIATVVKSFGKQEAGSAAAITSKAFAASKFSPSSAEALLAAASRSGGSAAALGLHDEEVLAANALLATSKGSAEMGGTQVASLLRSLDEEGSFKGMGLMQAVRDISSRGLEGGELQKLLGRSEAVEAYRVLAGNEGEYSKVLKAVQAAEQQDLVGKKLGFALSDPTMAARIYQQREKNQVALSRERTAQLSFVADQIGDVTEQNVRKAGGGELGASLIRIGEDALRWGLGDQRTIEMVASKSDGRPFADPLHNAMVQQAISPEADREFRESVSKLNAAGDKMLEAVGRQAQAEPPDVMSAVALQAEQNAARAAE